MIYIIKSIAARLLKTGDTFRDGGQTFQIADIEQNDDVVEIIYYTGTSSFVNSFFLHPDDTLDKVVDTTDERTLVLKQEALKALALNTLVATGETEIECEEAD